MTVKADKRQVWNFKSLIMDEILMIFYKVTHGDSEGCRTKLWEGRYVLTWNLGKVYYYKPVLY